MSNSRTEYNRQWRLKNKDKIKANRRRYLERHRDKINAQRREHRAKHKERYRLQSHRGYLKNREKILRTAREKNRKLRLEIITSLGGQCVNCGFKDWRVL